MRDEVERARRVLLRHGIEPPPTGLQRLARAVGYAGGVCLASWAAWNIASRDDKPLWRMRDALRASAARCPGCDCVPSNGQRFTVRGGIRYPIYDNIPAHIVTRVAERRGDVIDWYLCDTCKGSGIDWLPFEGG